MKNIQKLIIESIEPRMLLANVIDNGDQNIETVCTASLDFVTGTDVWTCEMPVFEGLEAGEQGSTVIALYTGGQDGSFSETISAYYDSALKSLSKSKAFSIPFIGVWGIQRIECLIDIGKIGYFLNLSFKRLTI